MIGNAFFGGFPSINTNVPSINSSATNLSNPYWGSVISMNNMYAFLTAGSYAPIYDTSVLTTGPNSTLRNTRRTVWSIGDNTVTASSTSEPLQPWFGAEPNVGNTVAVASSWSPAVPLANGAATFQSTSITTFTANLGDLVTVTFDHALPAGVILTAAVSATNTVTATLFNATGSALTSLPSGNLRFTVSPRV